MKRDLRVFILLGLLAVGMSGCAFSTDVVKIEYSPSRFTKVTESQKAIEVQRIKDIRGVEPTLLAYKGVQYKTTGKYVAEKEVADLMTDAIRQLLANLNYKVVEGKGDLTLTGEILKFDSQVLVGFWSGSIEGSTQVNFKLTDNQSRNIVWSEMISAYAKKTGLQVDREGHRKEVAEQVLDQLMQKLAESTTFKAAVEGAQ
jgi:hypothetical protein